MKKYLRIASILIFLAAIWITIFPWKDTSVHTSMFCAYGKLFVEFKEDTHVWGTLWLDSSGKPVPCSDNEKVSEKYIES